MEWSYECLKQWKGTRASRLCFGRGVAPHRTPAPAEICEDSPVWAQLCAERSRAWLNGSVTLAAAVRPWAKAGSVRICACSRTRTELHGWYRRADLCQRRRCMELHGGDAFAALCLHTTRCAELRQHQKCTERCSHLLYGMLVPACGALLSITLVGFTYQTSPTMVPQPGQHQTLPFTSRALMCRHTCAHTHPPRSCSEACS